MIAEKPKLEFENTSVKQVLEYCAEVGNFSIVFDEALQEAGIDLAARTVSIRGSGLTYENVLTLVLPKECGYRIEPGYILVTTVEKSWVPLVLRTYSVRMAMAEIPDFGGQAPRFELENLGKASGKAGGGGAVTLFNAQPAQEAAVPGTTPDRIIELIKKFVKNSDDRRIAPWSDDGGPATIEYLSGYLIVTQTDYGHRMVLKILTMIE
jgi:hypothetical protein